MCLYFSTGCRFSNLDPRQVDSPCCRPPDIQFPHCFDHKRGARRKGRQDKHRDPGKTDGAAAARTPTENNSTYSVLACLPSPYVFLFTNGSGKLNVHVTFTGGPNVVTCEQCMLLSCLNPQYNVCSFVVLQCPPYLMM